MTLRPGNIVVWPEPRNVSAIVGGVYTTRYTFPLSVIDFNLPIGKAKNCQKPDIASMVLRSLGDSVCSSSGTSSMHSATSHSLIAIPAEVSQVKVPLASFELGTPQ